MKSTPKTNEPLPSDHDGAVRINISLPSKLVRDLGPLLQARGYIGLSDYVRSCLRRDAGLEFHR